MEDAITALHLEAELTLRSIKHAVKVRQQALSAVSDPYMLPAALLCSVVLVHQSCSHGYSHKHDGSICAEDLRGKCFQRDAAAASHMQCNQRISRPWLGQNYLSVIRLKHIMLGSWTHTWTNKH